MLKAKSCCRRKRSVIDYKRLVTDRKRSRRTADVQKGLQALRMDCKLLLGLRRSVGRMVTALGVDCKLLLSLRRSVRRMVTALVQLLVTVADYKLYSQAGSTVIPASLFQGLWSIRRIVTLINTNTVTIMPASKVSF
jgi:hypothetical protein